MLHMHTAQMSHITAEGSREGLVSDWIDPDKIESYFMIDAGHAVGVCVTDIAPNNIREVSLLLTHPSYYRRQIATRLLNHCIIKSKQSGFSEMVLHVSENNEKAISLYKKAGFVFHDFVGHMRKMSLSL